MTHGASLWVPLAAGADASSGLTSSCFQLCGDCALDVCSPLPFDQSRRSCGTCRGMALCLSLLFPFHIFLCHCLWLLHIPLAALWQCDLCPSRSHRGPTVLRQASCPFLILEGPQLRCTRFTHRLSTSTHAESRPAAGWL